jgi:hypothetical protein
MSASFPAALLSLVSPVRLVLRQPEPAFGWFGKGFSLMDTSEKTILIILYASKLIFCLYFTCLCGVYPLFFLDSVAEKSLMVFNIMSDFGGSFQKN